ncbi:MAG: deoxyribonuclease IV [Candidatus Schekmanbacteria bacterium RBG_16_38_11]|uniref:Probable endonuclease 4 n=1 Tax=Candidatus Schekmanbacteria bacterium RBG_16_38_11 TaxID=1817880 RepID=A0A1F7S2R5_9BACT|nr:MAG: deoxyribonuclease IV [Candidatus Schekmanbacteria bacterium RBG_16_38_11]
MFIGAHMSIAGGVDKAVEKGSSINCTTIQIFTKSNTQWRTTPLKKKEVENFKKNVEITKISPVFGHNCYLINLASPDPEIYRKSIDTLLIELERSEILGLPYLVMHPGSHMGEGEKAGIERIAESLNKIFEKIKGYNVRVLLETTAGQGRSLGYKFEQLAEIMALVEFKEKLGVCLDTCHIFAAGYDIRSKYGYEKTTAEFNSIVGIDKIKAIHLNDSKKELGSKVDRHEHIGKGFIGLETFRYIMNDERFRLVPKVLETPKGEDMKEDVMNLKVLRGLIKRS